MGDNPNAPRLHRSGWINPRRHRSPRSVTIGGGDGDVGRSPRLRPPATRPLHRSPLQPPFKPFYRGAGEIYSTVAGPSPSICRWGNLRNASPTFLQGQSPLRAGDDGFPPLPYNPPVDGCRSMIHGPAGCVEKRSSPEAVGVEEETCSPCSPIASLPICSADRELWQQCVAEADVWAKEMWPSPDQ